MSRQALHFGAGRCQTRLNDHFRLSLTGCYYRNLIVIQNVKLRAQTSRFFVLLEIWLDTDDVRVTCISRVYFCSVGALWRLLKRSLC